MSKILKLEQNLLNKQILEAELDNLISEDVNNDMQLSIYILQGRKLPMSINSKVHRQLKFCIDNQIYETRSLECEGTCQVTKWNESHLIPIFNIDSSLKIVYIETETSNKPLGGVIIKLSGLLDQKRHDGWYDIGCGEIRLAIRFLHDSSEFYSNLIQQLTSSIQKTSFIINKSQCIVQEFRLDLLYKGIKAKNLKFLVEEAHIFRNFIEKSAKIIQNQYKTWKITQQNKEIEKNVRIRISLEKAATIIQRNYKQWKKREEERKVEEENEELFRFLEKSAIIIQRKFREWRNNKYRNTTDSEIEELIQGNERLESSARLIQKKFREWKSEKEKKIEQQKMIQKEVNDYFTAKIDELVKRIEEKQRASHLFQKNKNNATSQKEAVKKECLDIPPYLEIEEKVCKRRIPIKRY